MEPRLRGTICTVVKDGRFGLIRLDEPYLDRSLAVIGPDTNGRVQLMTDCGGTLQVHVPVEFMIDSNRPIIDGLPVGHVEMIKAAAD